MEKEIQVKISSVAVKAEAKLLVGKSEALA